MADFVYRSSSPGRMAGERRENESSVNFSASTPDVRSAGPAGRGQATRGAGMGSSRASNVSVGTAAGSESMLGLMNEFRELYHSRLAKLELDDDGQEDTAKVNN